jgi:hypothetical protein
LLVERKYWIEMFKHRIAGASLMRESLTGAQNLYSSVRFGSPLQ